MRPTAAFGFAFALAFAGPATATATAAGYRDTAAPLGVLANLDLARYLGKWYEIARFPNRFERGCQGVTAEYSQRADGTIKVLNTCREGAPDGPARSAEGSAKVVAPGKLTVGFVSWLPFAKGDYWVLYVDAGYSFAVVGEPSGKTGWVLSRGPALAPAKWDKALSVLASMGYDTTKLERVAQ